MASDLIAFTGKALRQTGEAAPGFGTSRPACSQEA